MNVDTLIRTDGTTLRPEQSLETAAQQMTQSGAVVLPVLAERDLVGLLTQQGLLDSLTHEPDHGHGSTVADVMTRNTTTVESGVSFEGVMRLMHDRQAEHLAVVDAEGHFNGLISRADLYPMIAQMAGVADPGATLEVAFRPYEYTLTDLVRVVEENGAKVISLLTLPAETDRAEHRISLKLSTIDCSRMRTILDRHGYNVLSCQSDQPADDDDYSIGDLLHAFLFD